MLKGPCVIKLPAERILPELEVGDSTRPICISGRKEPNIVVGGGANLSAKMTSARRRRRFY